MNQISKTFFPLFFSAVLLVFSCQKSNTDENDTITQTPGYQLIDSLISDKDTIWSGPQDPATIKCYATGDSVSYLWFSELGDIQINNSEGSEIVFTAADCCEGVREVLCTAKDSEGSDTDTFALYVLVDYGKK